MSNNSSITSCNAEYKTWRIVCTQRNKDTKWRLIASPLSRSGSASGTESYEGDASVSETNSSSSTAFVSVWCTKSSGLKLFSGENLW